MWFQTAFGLEFKFLVGQLVTAARLPELLNFSLLSVLKMKYWTMQSYYNNIGSNKVV